MKIIAILFGKVLEYFLKQYPPAGASTDGQAPAKISNVRGRELLPDRWTKLEQGV